MSTFKYFEKEMWNNKTLRVEMKVIDMQGNYTDDKLKWNVKYIREKATLKDYHSLKAL